MTFDLKDAYLSRRFSPEDAAAFDSSITIESIESVLKGLGHRVERIGSVDQLVVRLAGGDRWDMVFNIAEGVFGPGREFTVGILGGHDTAHTVGVLEVEARGLGDAGLYTNENKQVGEERVNYSLADDGDARAAGALAPAAWKGLGCLDAGRMDVRMDEQGMPCFIGVNPLPGFNPHSSDLPILSRLTGGKFETLITSIMEYTENRAMQRTRFRLKRVA